MVLLQPINEDRVCTEIHDLESGQSVSSCIKLPILTDPQKVGSAITYFRRYSLQSLLALQTDDDDGNKASQPTKSDVLEISKKLENSKTLKFLNVFVEPVIYQVGDELGRADILKLMAGKV